MHEGNAHLCFHPVGDAVAQRDRAGLRGGLHLAHVDQADQDRRNDGVAHQGHAVRRGITELVRGFDDQLAGRRQHAGLVENRRHFGRARVALRRLADGLRVFRARSGHRIGRHRQGRGRTAGRADIAGALTVQYIQAHCLAQLAVLRFLRGERALHRFELFHLRGDLAAHGIQALALRFHLLVQFIGFHCGRLLRGDCAGHERQAHGCGDAMPYPTIPDHHPLPGSLIGTFFSHSPRANPSPFGSPMGEGLTLSGRADWPAPIAGSGPGSSCGTRRACSPKH